MRVTLISLYYRSDLPTGANKRFECLIRALGEIPSVQITVIVARGHIINSIRKKVRIVEISVSRFPLIARVLTWLRLTAYLHRNVQGIVISDYQPPVITTNKSRVYQLVHDVRALVGHRRKQKNNKILRILALMALKIPSRFLTVSRYTQSEISAINKRADIVVSPNGLADDYFSSVNSEKRQWDILMVATFEERKNHVRAVQAIEKLVNSGRDVRCLFIGADGGEKEKIARLIKEKGLNEQITIAEQVKGEADFIRMGYDRSRVLFMPSLYEGFGMPILEAYSRGCRIVCSRIEPFIELDINGVRFFDPVSVDDMSYALSCALDDVQPIVGECINKYRWSVIAAKLINDVDVA